MSDADALLAAVLADPDADLPRLVFADHLDDAGEAARAEFIRLQVALAADPTSLPLRAREQLLLQRHAAGWLAPLRARGEPLQSPATHGWFRRGFVEEVWMPAGVFLTKADKLFRRAPVRRLQVTRAARGELSALFHGPGIRPLRELAFAGLSGAELAVRVYAADWLPPALALRNCGLTDAEAELIADAQADDWRPELLDVTHNPLGERGLDVLRRRYGPAVRVDRLS
jgi:uncharacterized protein (TIGR02996 family)